jgi:oligopeptide transport system substrate-binding protein
MLRDLPVLPLLALALVVAIPVALVLATGIEERAEFVFDLASEPETLDPTYITDQPGGRIATALFEGLTTRNPRTLAPEPGVAYRWDISPDGRMYTFHLRPARWSNGSPLTAGDFLFQWRRVLAPESGARYVDLFFQIENAARFARGELTAPDSLGFAALDDSTFVVRLARPTAYFLDLCAHYPFYPTHPGTVREHGEDWIRPEHIVSNGPFTLVDWQLRRRIRLRKNPEYWDAAHVDLALADAVFSEQASTAFNLYAAGETDWIDSSGIPPMIRDAVMRRPDFHTSPYLNTFFYRLNVRRPPLDDRRVRQALNLAIDKQAITTHITRSGQIPATHLVPPGLPGYVSPPGSAHDPARARALLAQAGYPGGRGFPPLELLFNTSEEQRPIAEVVQAQWQEELGIRCELRNQEWKVFLNSTRAGEYQVARGGWIGDYLDPTTFLDLWLPGNANNRTGWSDPAYTALIARAAAETDPAARAALLAAAESILLDATPIIPLYFLVTLNCYDETRFGGCAPNLLNMLLLKHVHRNDRAGAPAARVAAAR